MDASESPSLTWSNIRQQIARYLLELFLFALAILGIHIVGVLLFIVAFILAMIVANSQGFGLVAGSCVAVPFVIWALGRADKIRLR